MKNASVQVKQYREADGHFYYKIVDSAGMTLFLSPAFLSGQEAAQHKHEFGLLENSELETLSEQSTAVRVKDGFRFEVRRASGELLGSGPIVATPEESVKLRQLFLRSFFEMKSF